jgi:hypothetical protein
LAFDPEAVRRRCAQHLVVAAVGDDFEIEERLVRGDVATFDRAQLELAGVRNVSTRVRRTM